MRVCRSLVLVASLLLMCANIASAQEKSAGQREYEINCAVCHGADGKGNGPYAELLKVGLPDLTTLSRRNSGAFPAERLAELIDGRSLVPGHGTRDMPVWGYEYSKSAIDYYRDFYGKSDADRFVKGRIEALITYLRSIQQ